MGSIYDDFFLPELVILGQPYRPELYHLLPHIESLDQRSSSHGVFVWEGNGGTSIPGHALLHKLSVVIVEEKSPTAEVPAALEGSGGNGVYAPVPEVPGDVFVSS